MPPDVIQQDHPDRLAGLYEEMTGLKLTDAKREQLTPEIIGALERHEALREAAKLVEPESKKKKTPAEKWGHLDRDRVEADLHTQGHRYSMPANIVRDLVGLSFSGTGLYWWLDGQCFDGIRDPKGGWLKPPESVVIVGLAEIAQRFGCTRKTAQMAMEELRYAGVIRRIQRGANKRNAYELIPRTRRLEWQAHQDAMNP